jgi:ubiquinone/menaquinone biosynthesis C-methylase UbiE
MGFFVFVLRAAYRLLYHQLAWTYDMVAGVVSLGHWQEWILAAVPHINVQGRTLEIGYGPGHLQAILRAQGLCAFGIDESRQMTSQATRRLRRKKLSPNLCRGYAQNLPFYNEAFDSVVSTFPSEYIFDSNTLKEIRRVLVNGGSFVVVPMAWITGKRPWARLLAWLLRLIGEAPGKPGKVPEVVRERFNRSGFAVTSELVKMDSSEVLVVVGKKV